MKNKIIILLSICLFAVCTNLSFSQKGTMIKQLGKYFSKESIEESSKHIAKNELTDIGADFAEKAIAKQTIKKITREKLFQSIKKQGFNSFKEYACDNASKRLVKSNASLFSKKSISINNSYKNMILQLRKSANYINRTMRRILLTSKDQFVTSREYLSIINTKKVDLELGYPKNPGKLKSNMLKCMSEKTRNKIVNSGNKNQAHHIVGIKTPLATKKLERFKIDINDPMNGILLPQNEESGLKGTIHRGGHNQDYYNYIENLFLNCNSKQDCYDVLDKMKNDLYNGKIQLYNTHKANSTFTNKIAS